MGLDMYLHKYSKPSYPDGFVILPNTRPIDTIVDETDYQCVFTDGMRALATKGTSVNVSIDFERIIDRVFKKLTVAERSNMDLIQVGSVYEHDKFKSTHHVMLSRGMFVKSGLKEATPIFLDKGVNWSLFCSIEECATNISAQADEPVCWRFNVELRTDDEQTDYDSMSGSKYFIAKPSVMYAIHLQPLAYQRAGLDDIGWDYLPDNTAYCDDASVVDKLCKHGLDSKFRDEWIDGETVFWAWW